MEKRVRNKEGQVTIFVILAIVLVLSIFSYFIFKDTLFPTKVSSTFEPIEKSFLNCIQEKTENGIRILESKGGYITSPEFVPGSRYMPFSSELDFFGVGIPYWRSISGNNLPINQIPTKEIMQKQLESYLNEEVRFCNFDLFNQEGFQIKKGVPSTEVLIGKNSVKVFLDMNLNVKKGKESAVLKDHQVEVNSKLGALYDDAIEFYDRESKNLILENYSVDFLRNYAPVDGVELTCAPKVWDANQIFDKLKNAIQDNFFAIKNKGDKKDYFALNLPLNSQIRIINSKNWPSSYEVSPADSPILLANPVGMQEGLGILGFCYVPYHFVYNLKYPLLVQLIQDDETFQFPLSIIIEGNVANNTLSGNSIQDKSPNLCEGPFSNVTLNLVDLNSNPVEGNISYDCLGSKCQIGETRNGVFKGEFPQCGNGWVVVDSPGYKKSKELFSTVQGGSISVVLDKKYKKRVSLNIKNRRFNEKAIISFSSDGFSQTLVYPENNIINLSSGTYEIKVYLYDNSSIKFDATTIKQCVDVPSGIGGIFGITREECSEVKVPEQNISNVLVGGGGGSFNFLESDLNSDKILQISLERYNSPKTLQELQIVYALIDAKSVGVEFV